MSDQKQHAKITPEIRELTDRIRVETNIYGINRGAQILADALRDARLDEARQWKRRQGDDHGYTYGPHLDWGVERIIALERGEA